MGLKCPFYPVGGNKEHCIKNLCWNDGCGLFVTGESTSARTVAIARSGPDMNRAELEKWIDFSNYISEPAATPEAYIPPNTGLLFGAPWRAALRDYQWDLIRNCWMLRNLFKCLDKRQSGAKAARQAREAIAAEKRVYGRNLDETASVTSTSVTNNADDARVRRRRRLLSRLQGN